MDDDDVSTLASMLFSIFQFFNSHLLFSSLPSFYGPRPSLVQRSSLKCLKHGYPARNRAATQVGQKH